MHNGAVVVHGDDIAARGHFPNDGEDKTVRFAHDGAECFRQQLGEHVETLLHDVPGWGGGEEGGTGERESTHTVVMLASGCRERERAAERGGANEHAR